MFHWSIFTTSDPMHFVLTVPIHYIGLLITFPWVVWALAAVWKRGNPIRNFALLGAVLLATSFLSYSSRLTLDRTSGSAVLREFQFFHWSTRTYSLGQVDRIFVASGSTSSQLRLQLVDGHTRTLSFMDQYGGKDEVAFKANAFLNAAAGR